MKCIPKIIKRLVEDFGKSPYEINSGECNDFANCLIDELCKRKIPYTFETSWDTDLPTHDWVQSQGKHYDSECPNGVEDYLDLPFFKRYILKEGIQCLP